MTQTQTGWVVFVAALGMMAGLAAVDITGLHDWHEATTPAFIGTIVGHFGAVVTAFVGGKLLPSGKE